MQSALATLAGAEDVYYGANQRYSADPSITASLTLAPGVWLTIWSADQATWSASASHDSLRATCFVSGRIEGNGGFAVLDGPTCTDSVLSATARQARARGTSPVPTPPATAPPPTAPPPTASPAPTARTPAPVAAVSVLLPVAGAPAEEFGYPTQTIDRLAVRRLLMARSFDALDVLLAAYGDSVLRDYRLEYRLSDAYDAFHVALPSLEPPLTEWVQRRPNSAAALLARASFFAASGWHARGTKWARETPDEQFKRMGDFFRLAVADLVAAHRLAPRSIVPYLELMAIAGSQSNLNLSRQLLDEALTLQPNSFLLRLQHMYNLEPRWGGSYEAMAEFAAECAPYAARNVRIQALKGFADYDRGRELARTDHKAEALEAFGRALRFGNVWQFRYQRGRLYASLERPVEALEDLTAALVQRPQESDVLYERANVEYDLGHGGAGTAHFTQGFRDLDLAIELDPTDEYYEKSLAFYRANVPQWAPRDRP